MYYIFATVCLNQAGQPPNETPPPILLSKCGAGGGSRTHTTLRPPDFEGTAPCENTPNPSRFAEGFGALSWLALGGVGPSMGTRWAHFRANPATESADQFVGTSRRSSSNKARKTLPLILGCLGISYCLS